MSKSEDTVELSSFIRNNKKVLLVYPQTFDSVSILSGIYLYFILQHIPVGICCKNKDKFKLKFEDPIEDDVFLSYDNAVLSNYEIIVVESLSEYTTYGSNLDAKAVLYLETFGSLKSIWSNDYKLLKLKLCDLGSHIKYEVIKVKNEGDVLDRILNYLLYDPIHCHYIFSSHQHIYTYIKDEFSLVNIDLDEKVPVVLSNNLAYHHRAVKYLHITNILDPDDMIRLISGIYSNMSNYEEILTFHVVVYVNQTEEEAYQNFNKEYLKHVNIFNELYSRASFVRCIDDILKV